MLAVHNNRPFVKFALCFCCFVLLYSPECQLLVYQCDILWVVFIGGSFLQVNSSLYWRRTKNMCMTIQEEVCTVCAIQKAVDGLQRDIRMEAWRLGIFDTEFFCYWCSFDLARFVFFFVFCSAVWSFCFIVAFAVDLVDDRRLPGSAKTPLRIHGYHWNTLASESLPSVLRHQCRRQSDSLQQWGLLNLRDHQR